MCLFLAPIRLGEISAPNKPHKSSVMKQIMLPHTSSTVMAIIHKLDLRLCFTRLSVLLYNFLIMSSESMRYTKAILSSVPLSCSKPNFSCDALLLCSRMLIFTSGFYNSIFFPFPQLTSLCITVVKITSLQGSHYWGWSACVVMAFLAEPESLTWWLGEFAVAPRLFHGMNPHWLSACANPSYSGQPGESL